MKISRHLEGINFSGYWSCNAAFRLAFQHRYPELWREPKQAGTNGLREHISCAFIYSSKAQTSDNALIRILDLDRGDIVISQEYEDIWQFVMRGAIRNLEYGGNYDVYLYSRDQVEAVHKKLIESGISEDIEVVPVHKAGLLGIARPTKKDPDKSGIESSCSAEEQKQKVRMANRERKQRSRATARKEKERSGNLRSRGRPRKSIAASSQQ